ncbi:MAG TPA: arginase family protein [Thermomicrobiales bacterium]|nr:arginase family protein [Thermomicrobiales bacterium]
MPIQVVTVPYRYDERGEGLGAGPSALLEKGLIERLQSVGLAIAGTSESELASQERVPGRRALNIGRLGAATARLVAGAVAEENRVLVLCGDDTASIGVLAGLQAMHGTGGTIGLIWLDAHGDFNTPETSYSGILAGMPVAILAGLAGPRWRAEAGLTAPLATDRIIIAGVRELDEKEEKLLRSTDTHVISTKEVCEGESLRQAVDRLEGATDCLWIHVDLDVLDPRHVPSASTPAEDGLEIDELAQAMRLILETGKVWAVSVAGLNPGAGTRGERSVKTTLTLLERALPAWGEAAGA